MQLHMPSDVRDVRGVLDEQLVKLQAAYRRVELQEMSRNVRATLERLEIGIRKLEQVIEELK